MPKVHLVATKPLRYATRALHAGDSFSAIPKDARLLKLLGKAVDAPAGVAPELKPAEEADPVDALRAQYAELTGQEANKRWGARRLETEIDELTNPPPPVAATSGELAGDPVLEAGGEPAPEAVGEPAPEAGGDDDDQNGSLI